MPGTVPGTVTVSGTPLTVIVMLTVLFTEPCVTTTVGGAEGGAGTVTVTGGPGTVTVCVSVTVVVVPGSVTVVTG